MTFTHRTRTRRALVVAALFLCAWLSAPNDCQAQATDKFYYWVTPRGGLPTQTAQRVSPRFPEGFVIEVDAAIKAQIDDLLARGHEVGVNGRIAAGATSYNRNYYVAGHSAWRWFFSSIDSLRDFTQSPFDTRDIEPNRDAKPSTIEEDPQQWIATYGDSYRPKDFSVYRQIDPSKPDTVANVSNRGLASTGEKTLITGFIVKGGEPRNVVVRALGPSLGAFGVQQFATNPKIEVFGASGRRFASNTDWKADVRASALGQSYPTLAPSNDKEAALLLTLTPGAYTLQGTNEDGTEGVMLLEAYDVDGPQ